MPRALNDRQKQFCRILAKGKTSKRQAYIDAGYSPKSADQGASDLCRNPRIKAFLDKLRQATNSKGVMDLKARKEMLSRIAEGNEELDPKESRGAIDTLNKMDGVYVPDQHVVEVDGGARVKVTIGGNA